MNADQMRHAIMDNVRAQNLIVTGDLWLILAFRTDEELRQICSEMGINTKMPIQHQHPSTTQGDRT